MGKRERRKRRAARKSDNALRTEHIEDGFRGRCGSAAQSDTDPSSVPRDPPQADVGWPENVGMHDQVAAAMLDFLTGQWEERPREDLTPEEAAAVDRESDVLIELGKSVPPDRSVSVLVELQDGHVLSTMLNDERGPTMTVLYYGIDDPNRLRDPQEGSCILLDPPEHLVS